MSCEKLILYKPQILVDVEHIRFFARCSGSNRKVWGFWVGDVEEDDVAQFLARGDGSKRAADHAGADEAAVYVRPHDIEIFPVAEDRNALRAVVNDFVSIGPRVRVSLARAYSKDGSARMGASRTVE